MFYNRTNILEDLMANLSFQSAVYNRSVLKQNTIHKQKQTNEDLFTFESMIQRFSNIPEATAILGKTGQMPILFDLEDPRPGSILLVNDHLPSLRKFMTVMMKSLVVFSHPSNFQFVTISHHPDKWMDQIQEFDPEYTFCAGVSGDYETSAEDWIMFLTKKADDRISGRNRGASAILFLDDIDLIQNIDVQAQINFKWLLQNGAQSRIWIVSGLDLKKSPDSLNRINEFKTNIYGQLSHEEALKIQKHVPLNEVKKLSDDRNFITKIGPNWIPFWAPKLQG